MTKKYKFGDKVNAYEENAIITSISEIKNDSGDKYLDYMYIVSFEDDTYADMSYEDFETGWIKEK